MSIKYRNPTKHRICKAYEVSANLIRKDLGPVYLVSVMVFHHIAGSNSPCLD